MINSFFSELNYSSVNEDSSSEAKALAIRQTDRVLCVTGSGSRTLDLLIQQPAEIISIDLNPTQNYLLQLKLAAIQVLSLNEYKLFTGIQTATHKTDASQYRLKTYQSLIELLDQDTRLFWNRNLKKIQNGIYLSGRWEHYLKLSTYLLRKLRKKTIHKLLEQNSTEDQYNYWKKHWDNLAWRTYLKLLSNRLVWKYLLKEPGINFVDRQFNISEYMFKRFDNAAKNILFRDSAFIRFLFTANFESDNALPRYLTETNYRLLQPEKVTIITEKIDDFLMTNSGKKIDCFSVSDVGSYMNKDNHLQFWQLLSTQAAENARILERQFLNKRNPDSYPNNRLTRDFKLEQQLEQSDNSIIYTFVAGKFSNNP